MRDKLLSILARVAGVRYGDILPVWMRRLIYILYPSLLIHTSPFVSYDIVTDSIQVSGIKVSRRVLFDIFKPTAFPSPWMRVVDCQNGMPIIEYCISTPTQKGNNAQTPS